MEKDNLLFVTNTDSDDISVVSINDQVEISRISVGGSPRGSVRFDKEKKFGYISNCGGNTISVIDLNNFREVSKITVGLAPRGMAISQDGNIAFISNSGSNTLSIVDLKSRQQINEIAMGRNPRHMFMSGVANKLFVAEWGSDTVSIFDFNIENKLEFLNLRKSIFVGKDAKPYSLAVNNDGTKAYVANTKANYMSVIDVKEEVEIDRIEVGFGGRAIAINPDDKYGFITIENSNEVAVVDFNAGQVVNRAPVGFSPRGIVMDKSTMKIYTADFDRSSGTRLDGFLTMKNSLTVLDASSPINTKAISQIQVGLGPCSVSLLEREKNNSFN